MTLGILLQAPSQGGGFGGRLVALQVHDDLT